MIVSGCRVQVMWNNLFFFPLSEQPPLSKITPVTGKHSAKASTAFSTAHLPAAKAGGQSVQAFHRELQVADSKKKGVGASNTQKNEPFLTCIFAQC